MFVKWERRFTLSFNKLISAIGYTHSGDLHNLGVYEFIIVKSFSFMFTIILCICVICWCGYVYVLKHVQYMGALLNSIDMFVRSQRYRGYCLSF